MAHLPLSNLVYVYAFEISDTLAFEEIRDKDAYFSGITEIFLLSIPIIALDAIISCYVSFSQRSKFFVH